MKGSGIMYKPSNIANLIFNDGVFKFYIEPLDNPNMASLIVIDDMENVAIRHTFLARFGNNPLQKVYKGKSGTYEYYRVTFSCENICQELVLLPLCRSILKPIYFDREYADKNLTRLSVRTKKGGLTVKRVPR